MIAKIRSIRASPMRADSASPLPASASNAASSVFGTHYCAQCCYAYDDDAFHRTETCRFLAVDAPTTSSAMASTRATATIDEHSFNRDFDQRQRRLIDAARTSAASLGAADWLGALRALDGHALRQVELLMLIADIDTLIVVLDALDAHIARATLRFDGKRWTIDAAASQRCDDDNATRPRLRERTPSGRRSTSPRGDDTHRRVSPRTWSASFSADDDDPLSPRLDATRVLGGGEHMLSDRSESTRLVMTLSVWQTVMGVRAFDASRGNAPRGVPRCVMAFESLRSIDVSHNATSVCELPVALARLRWLERLVASDCSIATLPYELARCRRLRVLDVARNVIRTLPVEYDALDRLEVLRARGNRLEHFEGALLARWAQLVELDLVDNPLRRLDLSSLAHRRADAPRLAVHVSSVHIVFDDANANRARFCNANASNADDAQIDSAHANDAQADDASAHNISIGADERVLYVAATERDSRRRSPRTTSSAASSHRRVLGDCTVQWQ